MAGLTGAKGLVTIPSGAGGQTILITRWTASIDREIFDISNFDDGLNERSKLGGMIHLVGTVEGTIDDAASPVLTQMQAEDSTGTAGFKLVFKDSTTDGEYSFTGIVSNISVDVPKAGRQTFSMSFESSGAITVVNAA